MELEGIVKSKCARCQKSFIAPAYLGKKYCTVACAIRAKSARYQAKATGAIKDCRKCGKEYTQSQKNKWYCPRCQADAKLVKKYYCWNCYACTFWKDIYLVNRSGQVCERCKRDYVENQDSGLAEAKFEAGYSQTIPLENRKTVPGVRVSRETEKIPK